MSATIQQRLRILREEMGISQEKLAAELGVTRMTLAGYELGKRPPDSDFIIKVAGYFGCTPDYIFGISPFKNNRHYEEWVSSNDTLTVALSILPDAKRKELVTALNWLLQDNSYVNDFAADKDYLIDKHISLTLNFTHIFQEFTRVLLTGGGEINGETIYNFFTEMGKDKNDISKTVATATNELLQFLLKRSKELALPNN